jgi:hypothetical protein
MSVGKIDPPCDAVKVGLADNLDKLVNAALGMDVLDVGLVLLDQPVERERVEPDGVVDVSAVLVGRRRLKSALVELFPDRTLPLGHGVASLHPHVVVGELRVDEGEVAVDGL